VPESPIVMNDRFDHEKLDAYAVAVDFVGIATTLVSDLPRGRAFLADQLYRASSSIVLNIAEGAGEFAPREKARFYRMARRSATECAAIVDVLFKFKAIDESARATARGLLVRIVAMLTRMAQQFDSGTGSGSGSGSGTDGGSRED